MFFYMYFYLFTVPLVLMRYLLKLCQHKLIILFAGMYVNWKMRRTAYSISWRRLLFHDWSKMTWSELWPYANYFYGPSNATAAEKEKRRAAFVKAFQHHTEWMDHHVEYHWQRFIIDATAEQRMEMARTAKKPSCDGVLVEIIVDWMAAEVAYMGRIPRPHQGKWKWVVKTIATVGLHQEAAQVLSALLCALGYDEEVAESYHWTEKERSARQGLPAQIDHFAQGLGMLDHEKLVTLRRACC